MRHKVASCDKILNEKALKFTDESLCKGIWKSFEIWRSYGQELVAAFWTYCIRG